MGFGEFGGAGGLWDGREKVQIPRVVLPAHLPIPADGLQFTSVAHAVSQADETLSKALVYGVTVAWARCSCCQGRYRDCGWGWRLIDRMRQCTLNPPTPRGLFTRELSGDVTQLERGTLGNQGAHLGTTCLHPLLGGPRQDRWAWGKKSHPRGWLSPSSGPQVR